MAQLRTHGIALVVAETAGKWPLLFDITADFMYLRLHGDRELYRSGYSDRALDKWAQRIRGWRDSRHARNIYVYFDNTDFKLRAPIDAKNLARKLGIETGAPASLPRPSGQALNKIRPKLSNSLQQRGFVAA